MTATMYNERKQVHVHTLTTAAYTLIIIPHLPPHTVTVTCIVSHTHTPVAGAPLTLISGG